MKGNFWQNFNLVKHEIYNPKVTEASFFKEII